MMIKQEYAYKDFINVKIYTVLLYLLKQEHSKISTMILLPED